MRRPAGYWVQSDGASQRARGKILKICSSPMKKLCNQTAWRPTQNAAIRRSGWRRMGTVPRRGSLG
ncbi:hypothetical protein PFLCHA0_c35650 [Pseudomonas protegens CHA0]|uniref:Uncharacterized protein n=1 Tax=Pseudomonas protegens (strain DSM 19095 / LMG 27888 / CFBP 6595 / CHA0) TaxID=1124983 RepID=A0A2C9ENU6_PSEPH|nr:hypothetical protein PFLCHA0_c35650 [Pseudomonas protegens CHA0]